ncbi:MAG: DUF4469 domain-containing protein [Tannerellaceae bacterium]|jgi:hypothetical protein|nr:DUF4469 domain-containing protein [Tannerellaceae bacterium]
METIPKLKDVIHSVTVWLAENTLPNHKKKYIALPQALPYLSVREVAAKASLYDEYTDPEDMVLNVNQYFNLCAYLAADGYGIENLLFRTRIGVPGEYDGYETSLPEGVRPEPRIQVTRIFRQYLKDNVKVDIKGVDEANGHIFTVADDVTGKENEVITIGRPIHINGTGLKIEHDDSQEHIDEVGLWFIPTDGMRSAYRSASVIINEPHTLAAIVPEDLVPETDYYIEAVTRSGVKNGSAALTEVRRVRAEQLFIAKS